MPSWNQIRDQKLDEQNEAITNVRSSLEPVPPADDLPYLSASASQIVNNITSRTSGWTAVRVLQAYIRSALRAHEKTRCLTEVMFQEALRDAAALDEKFEATGEIKGMLHGVPISLKDQVNFKDYDSTVGFTAWANDKASEDATIVKIIRAEGGIPFVKTNIPQTLLAFACSNPLWGESTNPYNEAATCGGSSGGEAALLGCDGSVIGIGSDIGGSLRIPAHYSGIYSLKPTNPRFPAYGTKNPKPGFESVKSTYGPMARSVEDLELLTQAVINGAEKYWFAEGILPKHYAEFSPRKGEKLSFGYYTQDNFVYTSPACERAVLETVEALRAAGHEVIELPEAPDVGKACALFSSLASADGYSTYSDYIGSDPQDETLRLTTLGTRLPAPVRWLAAQIGYYVLGDRCVPSLLLGTRAKSVKELQQIQDTRTQFVRRWQTTVWSEEGLQLDGIIAPVQAIPAPGKNTLANFSPISASTHYYNLVDSTVGVIPVTTVDPQKDSLTPDWFQQFDRVTAPAFQQGTMSKLLNNGLYRGSVFASEPLYDAKKMQGQPVGVQLVGPPWQEEKVLYMMKAVDGALGPRNFGPGSSFKRQ